MRAQRACPGCLERVYLSVAVGGLTIRGAANGARAPDLLTSMVTGCAIGLRAFCVCSVSRVHLCCLCGLVLVYHMVNIDNTTACSELGQALLPSWHLGATIACHPQCWGAVRPGFIEQIILVGGQLSNLYANLQDVCPTLGTWLEWRQSYGGAIEVGARCRQAASSAPRHQLDTPAAIWCVYPHMGRGGQPGRG